MRLRYRMTDKGLVEVPLTPEELEQRRHELREEGLHVKRGDPRLVEYTERPALYTGQYL